MEDRRIKAIVVESKEGRQAAVAKNFVDASGDADLFFFAGAGFETGAKLISLEGRVFVPDPDAYFAFVRGQGEKFTQMRTDNDIHASFGARMHRRTGEIRKSSCSWPKRSSIGEGTWNGLDVDVLTRIETESRKELKKMVDFYRANVPGCDNMIQLETSSQLGVRETRRATGDHVLTMEEVKDRTGFDDCIGRSGAPDGYHEIPYRSIYSRDIDNLWVAGRCISADHDAQGPIRIIPACVVTGEAAGTAAALAIKHGAESARDLSTETLVDQLLKQGMALRDSKARLP